MVSPKRRSACRTGTCGLSISSRIIVSLPRKAALTRLVTSAAENGPRPPNRCSASSRQPGQQFEPAAQVAAHRLGDFGARQACRDHLVQDADIAGRQIIIEEIAGALPTVPQRHRCGECRRLALQQALVQMVEQGQEQPFLGTEMIVDLAERNAGDLGNAARRQIGIAASIEAQLGGRNQFGTRVALWLVLRWGNGFGSVRHAACLPLVAVQSGRVIGSPVRGWTCRHSYLGRATDQVDSL